MNAESLLDLNLSDQRLRIQTKEKAGEKITKEDYLALGLLYLRRYKGWKRGNISVRLKTTDRTVTLWEKAEKFPEMPTLELLKKLIYHEVKINKA